MDAKSLVTKVSLSPGRVVQLRSGGPLMTVLDVGTHTSQVCCRWLVDGKPAEAWFPVACLRECDSGQISNAA
jgi:uncharacterized protein YodC (DUF2158 family)